MFAFTFGAEQVICYCNKVNATIRIQSKFPCALRKVSNLDKIPFGSHLWFGGWQRKRPTLLRALDHIQQSPWLLKPSLGILNLVVFPKHATGLGHQSSGMLRWDI